MAEFCVSEYEKRSAGVSLRLAIVADLHDRDGISVAQRVLSISPDACLFVGDLFEAPPRRRSFSYGEAERCLEMLAPHCTLFWSRGNHDATLPAPLAATMERLGVHCLDDAYEPYRGILIGGLSSAHYRAGRRPDMTLLERLGAESAFKLLLCHHPEYYDRYIRGRGIDLTVSGHAHGGQWRVGGRGVFAPGQGLFPRYTSGFYDEGRLLVSRGTKRSLCPRFGNPPEILLLTLSE